MENLFKIASTSDDECFDARKVYLVVARESEIPETDVAVEVATTQEKPAPSRPLTTELLMAWLLHALSCFSITSESLKLNGQVMGETVSRGIIFSRDSPISSTIAMQTSCFFPRIRHFLRNTSGGIIHCAMRSLEQLYHSGSHHALDISTFYVSRFRLFHSLLFLSRTCCVYMEIRRNYSSPEANKCVCCFSSISWISGSRTLRASICPSCKARIERTDTTMFLYTARQSTIQQCIENHMKCELIEMSCPQCKNHVDVPTKRRFEKLPETLVLYVKRNKEVQLTSDGIYRLDLSAHSRVPAVYDLSSTINYDGDGRTGHLVYSKAVSQRRRFPCTIILAPFRTSTSSSQFYCILIKFKK